MIVVVNKSDGGVPQRQLDEAGLRRAYPVVTGFVRTSCNADAAAAASIAGLRVQIAATLDESARLKHVRDPIPQSWLRIKEAIAETGAIYTLINSPTVRDQGGELRHDQLGGTTARRHRGRCIERSAHQG